MCCTDFAIPGAHRAAAPMSAFFGSLKASLLEPGGGADWFRVRYGPQASVSPPVLLCCLSIA